MFRIIPTISFKQIISNHYSINTISRKWSINMWWLNTLLDELWLLWNLCWGIIKSYLSLFILSWVIYTKGFLIFDHFFFHIYKAKHPSTIHMYSRICVVFNSSCNFPINSNHCTQLNCASTFNNMDLDKIRDWNCITKMNKS